MSDGDKATKERGLLLRARNGGAIGYDPTGLVMRLSDRVIADIAARLDIDGRTAPAESGAPATARPRPAEIDRLLAGVDAWDARVEGDWISFMARRPGRQGTRRFRRHVAGGAIVADAPGAFLGLFTLGGPRAALATEGPNRFPHHVLAPADDIGAVGQGGEGAATPTAHVMELREQTHEALVAETLLDWRFERHADLPLFMVRCETMGAAGAAQLADGPAIGNLIRGIENFARAAGSLGKRAGILAIGLDFVLEDVLSDAATYRDAMLAAMRRIEAALAAAGFDRPLFVTRVETVGPLADNPAAVEGQWELCWNHADHRLRVSAPGFMFAADALDRPTEDSRREMAEMTAAALEGGDDWRCPLPHLAERAGDGLRVVLRAADDLIVDAADPLGAGPGAGFHLDGVENGAAIASVRVDPADPQTLLVDFDRRPEGARLILCHGTGAAPASAIRDGWSLQSRTGRMLHRWALPARLPVTGGVA
jgi:hypothetical protein